MHFAVGMCGGAAVMAVPCLILRRGWRHIPLAMTLGGIWAVIPDSPRLWREDFTSLPFAATLGAKDFELWLHSIGDLFFFHRSLDAQPKEFALLGLVMIIGLYNLSLIGMLWQNRRARHRLVRHHVQAHHQTPTANLTASPRSGNPAAHSNSATDPPSAPDSPPVIGRIGSG